jgi:multisubunit Na+/H+ antiporter MnhG subunit
MHLLAHHLGEQALAPMLLLAGGWLTLAAAIGRARFADARARLGRKRDRGAS